VRSDDEAVDGERELPLVVRDVLVHLLLRDLAAETSPGAVAHACRLLDADDAAAAEPAAAEDRTLHDARVAVATVRRTTTGRDAPPGLARRARARLDAYARALVDAPRGESLPTRLAQAAQLSVHGLFFEVHEVLEPAWRVASGDQRTVLQGVIQAAVASYHARRGNRAGARRLAASALAKLGPAPDVWHAFPLGRLRHSLSDLIASVDGGGAVPPPAPERTREGTDG